MVRMRVVMRPELMVWWRVAVGAEWWHGYVVGWYSGFDELESDECGYVGVGAWGGG